MIGKVKHPYMFKVLPLVYDNSLSYYEVINKLINKQNEIIEAINTNFEQLVLEHLDDVFGESTYNEATETITISISTQEV